MKNIIRILAAAILTVSLSGCADFLGEKITTQYDGAAMISSESALESAMMGIHRQMASSGFKGGAFCEWLAPASGLAHWGNTSALDNPLERWSCGLKFTRFSKHPEAYDSFKNFYRTIYLCKHFLDIIEDSPVDKSYTDEIKGETYFLRAMAHFYLVRLYGDCSLHIEAPLTSAEVYTHRENFWTVYCQIVKDLNVAEDMMRDWNRMVAVAGGNSSGRVCNYTATACRSLVYLTIGSLLAHPDDNFWVNRTPDFSEIGINSAEDAFRLALADAENVIVNGPFELCPDYRQLFRWTNPEDWQLKERIWAMPRSPEAGDANSALTMWALPNYYNGTSDVPTFGRCRPDRWFYQKWCEAFGGTKGTGDKNSTIYTSSMDPRMDANIAHTSYKGKGGTPYNLYPTNNRIHQTTASMVKYYGAPYYKKYYDPTYDNSVGNADFYVMRMAEVYLIAAEATAYLHYTSANAFGKTAMDYVNVVRLRARNSTDGGSEAPALEPADLTAEDFTDKDQLINTIFWERCFEMPFEHHEYFDTHRMGAKWIVENIAKPKNVFLYLPEQEDFEQDGTPYDGFRTIYYGRSFKYDEDWNDVRKGLISAYPHDELVYNTCLDETKSDPNYGQNPPEVYWR